MIRVDMSNIKLKTNIRLAVEQGQSISQVLNLFWTAHGGVVYPPIEYFQSLLLCAAVGCNRNELVKALLEEHFPVNYNGGHGSMKPLHIACRLGDEDLIGLLLKHGGDVNASGTGEVGSITVTVASAAEYILMHDDVNLMKMILELFDPRLNKGKSILHLACQRNSPTCVEYILREKICHVDESDYSGHTPLSAAVTVSRRLVKTLLDNGASVTSSRTPCTLLALNPFAPWYPNPHFLPGDVDKIIMMLLDFGEDLAQCSSEGKDGLIYLLHQIPLTIQQYIASCQESPDRLEKHHGVILKTIEVLLSNNYEIKWQRTVSELRDQIQNLGNYFHNKRYCSNTSSILSSAFEALISAIHLFNNILYLLIYHEKSSLADLCPYRLFKEVFSSLPELQQAMVWYDGDWIICGQAVAATFHILLTTFGHAYDVNQLNFYPLLNNWPSHQTLFCLFLESSPYDLYTEMLQSLMTHNIQSDESHEFVCEKLYNPRSLRETARVVIIESLKIPKSQSVKGLCVPKRVHQEIMLSHYSMQT